jgi:Restriction endonuclease NotI
MTKPAPATKVAELYGLPTIQLPDWKKVAAAQKCPFLGRKCLKNRKSEPEITIGTCTMIYGRQAQPVVICPFRLLERSQIFTDCVHLLKLHEPGNELRIVAELAVPGGSIDYCLVSVRDGKPRDFVGIELQTLDTTGTVWPERQRFLRQHKVRVKPEHAASEKSFGMNWKMTAKTILVQLNHKIATFEHLNKRFVLVLQDCLLDYMRREFAFNHIQGVRDGDPMQFHAYGLREKGGAYSLVLKERIGTDTAGIAMCIGLQADSKVELRAMLTQIESKLPQSTLLTVGGGPVPIPEVVDIEADEG